MARGKHEQDSPLDVAEAAFDALVSGPLPLSLDARRIGQGLPARRIRLDRLRTLLLDPATGWRTRDAAWAELVRRSRSGGPSWMVGAVGVAIPGLRRTAAQLARRFDGEVADLDAEVLTGFLSGLKTVDISKRRIALRLGWAAYRAGAKLRYADALPMDRRFSVDSASAPPRPWGHPDLVLADAVANHIITATEANLIGSTRLDGIPLTHVARRLGLGYDAARMRRSRAELRLVQAITDGDIQSHMFDLGS